MVNGSRYYRALESVSIESALTSALTIYPCQIRVHQTLTVLNSPTSYSSEEEVAAGHSGQFTPGGYLSAVTHTPYFSKHRTHNLPMLVRRAIPSINSTLFLQI